MSRPIHRDPPDALAALAALRRARKRAEGLALATDTLLVQAVNGKPVLVQPKPEAAADEGQQHPGHVGQAYQPSRKPTRTTIDPHAT
jgi:hypothetical protein